MSSETSGGPCVNTDRELWREREGDYYADSIHVTETGGIGMNCGGRVAVLPIREWHKLAWREPSLIDGETLRTDAKERESEKCDPKTHAHYGWKFARKLERELSQQSAELAALRGEVERLRRSADEWHHCRSCDGHSCSDAALSRGVIG